MPNVLDVAKVLVEYSVERSPHKIMGSSTTKELTVISYC